MKDLTGQSREKGRRWSGLRSVLLESAKETEVQVHLVCRGQCWDLLVVATLQICLDLDKQVAVGFHESIGLQGLD